MSEEKRHIKDFPNWELLLDRAACEQDIALCELALRARITHYGDGATVGGRLERNKLIIAVIDAELARRELSPESGHGSPDHDSI